MTTFHFVLKGNNYRKGDNKAKTNVEQRLPFRGQDMACISDFSMHDERTGKLTTLRNYEHTQRDIKA